MKIENSLKTRWLGRSFYYDEATGSTNIRIRELADAGAVQGTVAAAGTQTAGKGRRGRGWVSPKDKNLYFSLLLRPEFPPDRAPMLTMVTAYGAALAIRRVTGIDVQIKWPNDLVAEGKKICGILTEMSVQDGKIRYVIVGIGINTNMEEFPTDLTDKATSLRLVSKKEIDRAALLSEVLLELERAYERYGKEQNAGWLKDDYNRMLANCGRQVRILDPAGEYEATALGIDEEGRLLVKKADGSTDRIFSGEVSVRGLYGYT